MTSELVREALSVLAELHELGPDVRLGQLFAHLGTLGEMHLDKGLGYLDDDELVALMYRHRDELIARLRGTALPLPPSATVALSGVLTEPATR